MWFPYVEPQIAPWGAETDGGGTDVRNTILGITHTHTHTFLPVTDFHTNHSEDLFWGSL